MNNINIECKYPEIDNKKGYTKGCRCILCKKAKSDRAKIDYLKNKDRIDKRCIENQKKKPEYYKQYRAEYYIKNSTKIKKRVKEYGQVNAEANKTKRSLKHKIRMKQDPWYALQHNLRGRLRIAFDVYGFKKSKPTLTILGCSLIDLKDYLEVRFKHGMSWDNYGRGGWVMDHIIPLNFAKEDINKLYDLCHYTNLQPLWESENCSKGDKLI